MKVKKYIGYTSLFLAIFFLDRFSKDWIVHHVELPQQFNRFISVDLIINRGIAWGLFHSQDSWQFFIVTMAVIIVGILLVISLIEQARKGCSIIGQLFITSGALSNLVDRYYYHGVVDFIILSIKTWSWPVFNIADCCIVFGMLIIMYQSWKEL